MFTPAVIANTINFLNRVTLTGPEAYAWVEAVNALQATSRAMQAFMAQGPGVPFKGPQDLSPQLDLAI